MGRDDVREPPKFVCTGNVETFGIYKMFTLAVQVCVGERKQRLSRDFNGDGAFS